MVVAALARAAGGAGVVLPPFVLAGGEVKEGVVAGGACLGVVTGDAFLEVVAAAGSFLGEGEP